MTEEALQLMQFENLHKHKKIKGFVKPFNMATKDERIDKNDKSKKYKFKSKEDKEAIKEKVKELKRQRELAKKQAQVDKDNQYKKHRNVMKHIHEKLARQKDYGGEEVPNYQVRDNSQIYDVSLSQPALKLNPHQRNPKLKESKTKANKLPNKFTMDSLMRLNYDDVAGSGPDGFNPADILDEDSDSNDSVLNQYKNDDKNILMNQASDQSLPQDAYAYRGNKISERAVPMDQNDPGIANMKGGAKKGRRHNNSIMQANHSVGVRDAPRKRASNNPMHPQSK